MLGIGCERKDEHFTQKNNDQSPVHGHETRTKVNNKAVHPRFSK